MMKRLAILAALLLAACATPLAPVPGASEPGAPQLAPVAWSGAWGASPTPPPATARSFENQTLRQVVRISAGGDRVRVRLTNEYGKKPLVIGAATIARAGEANALDTAAIPLTFNGAKSVTIPAGAPMLSDPVDMKLFGLDRLSVSLFLPQATGPCTCHPLGMATTWISGPGDFAAQAFTSADTFTSRAFLSGVEVEGASKGVIVAFGDSITDGFGSTINGDARWPDVLARRLGASSGIGVVNAAISGNRVLSEQLEIFGQSALTRFDRDVLSVPNAKWLVVMEGINDIGQGGDARPSVDVMINGYRQLIARAHAEGLKIYGATLTPYEGARYYSESGEVVRQAANQWIRTGGAFDAVIDFDAVVRDPANPKKMRANFHVGDWLHPNDAGYKAMGEAVDLALFN